MHFLDSVQDKRKKQKLSRIKILVFLIGIFSLILAIDLTQQNWDKLKPFFVKPVVINNFDEIQYLDNLKRIMHPSGAFWVISYESTAEISFSGLVGYTAPIHEKDFALLTNDFLITNGDYSNPFVVEIKVQDHRYHWLSWHDPRPNGSIGLLHVIPLNEDINRKLNSIQNGDAVVVKGYDIYRIDSFDKHGNYVGYWQDDGCFTTLVTEVSIFPGALSKSSPK
jgi:hypothetical protein